MVEYVYVRARSIPVMTLLQFEPSGTFEPKFNFVVEQLACSQMDKVVEVRYEFARTQSAVV